MAFGFAAEVSMRLAAGLFGSFAVLVLANLIAGKREVSCGCFGNLSSSSYVRGGGVRRVWGSFRKGDRRVSLTSTC